MYSPRYFASLFVVIILLTARVFNAESLPISYAMFFIFKESKCRGSSIITSQPGCSFAGPFYQTFAIKLHLASIHRTLARFTRSFLVDHCHLYSLHSLKRICRRDDTAEERHNTWIQVVRGLFGWENCGW